MIKRNTETKIKWKNEDQAPPLASQAAGNDDDSVGSDKYQEEATGGERARESEGENKRERECV